MKKTLLIAFALTFAAAGSLFNANAELSDKKKENQTEKREERSVKQEHSFGKPQLIISGEASVHPNIGSPSNTYYGQAVTASGAGPTLESVTYDKSTKDSSMTRIVAGEADIDFKAVGTLDNGIKYMAEIDIDAMCKDTGVDKMYLSFSKKEWGTLLVGNVKGPDAKCVYSGQQLVGGTTGMDGTVPHSFDFAAGVIAPINVIGYSGKATKFAYFSPRFYGFQFAASLTPDTKQFGHNDKDWRAGSASTGNDNGMFIKGKSDHKPTGRNNIALALNYAYEFQNGVDVKLSGIYVSEDTKPLDVVSYERVDADNSNPVNAKASLRKVSSYHLSATVGYGKWTFGVGFLNNGKSRTLKSVVKSDGTDVSDKVGNFIGTTNANAGKAWNIGVRYRLNDQWTLSGVFHHTKRKVDTDSHTKGNMLTLAADYKVVDGLVLFTEVDYVNTKSSEVACQRYNMIFQNDKDRNAILKQDGTLLVLGAKVIF